MEIAVMRRAVAVFSLGLFLLAGAATAQAPCINQSPVEVGFVDGIGNVRQIALAGTVAYAVAGPPVSRIEAIDVSDPTSAFHIGTIATHSSCGYITDTEVVDGLLYSVDNVCSFQKSRLEIVDVSDPANPFVVGTLGGGQLPRPLFDVEVSGTYAYILDLNGNFYVIDVSDPTTPIRVGFLGVPVPGTFNDLKISGSYAYTTGKTFNIIDISDPTDPAYKTILSIGNGTLFDAEISSTTAFVTSGNSLTGLVLLDVSDPTAVVELSSHLVAARHVAFSPGRAYVTIGAGGNPSSLMVVDVADPSAPLTLAQSETGILEIDDVEVGLPFVYLAARADGIRIFDLQCDDTTPQAVHVSKNQALVEPAIHFFVGLLVGIPGGVLCSALTLGACAPLTIMGALSAALYGIVLIDIILDPPDPEYLTVYSPQNYPPYFLSSVPGLPQAAVDQANATFGKMTDLYELLEAWRVTLERHAAAVDAGDSVATAMQLAALEGYIENSAAASRETAAALSEFNDQLQQLTGLVPLTQADVIAAQTALVQNGFSAEQLTVFSSLGISEAEVASLLDGVAVADPATVPGEAYAGLNLVSSGYEEIAAIANVPSLSGGWKGVLPVALLAAAWVVRRADRR